jgi:hypothetical protein
LRNKEGCSFSRVFERKEKPLYVGKFLYEEFERYVKKRPCIRTAVSIGALVGNLERVRLLGLLREKRNAYLGSFSWTQKTLKVQSGGHLELQQGTGFH